MKKDNEWRQSNLQVGHSPLNLYFAAKRWFEKWDSRFKYNEFFLSWQVWWLILWSGVYTVLMYCWITAVWSRLPESIPALYISHSLKTVMLDRYFLIGISLIPVPFAVAVLILTKLFGKSQRDLASLWVILQMLISGVCFVTAFKIATIYG